MEKQETKLYLVFTTTFLVMHFTGVMLTGIPYILNALVTSVSVFIVFFLLQNWNARSSVEKLFRDTGFKKVRIKAILPGVTISIALILVYPLLGFLLSAKLVLAKNWLLNLIGLFLTAGLTEEMLFRGYLFNNLRKERNFRSAAFISTIVFSLAHLFMFFYMAWPVASLSTILAMTISVPLAYLFERANYSIWSPAILHTAIRTIGLVVTVEKEYFNELSMLWILASIIIPNIGMAIYKKANHVTEK